MNDFVCVLEDGSIRISRKDSFRLESSVLENQLPNSTMFFGQEELTKLLGDDNIAMEEYTKPPTARFEAR